MKSKFTAYFLWFGGFIFLCGLHRLYIGKTGTGLLWLFTLGLCGIGQLIDIFTLGSQVDLYNALHGGNRQTNTQTVIVNVAK